MKGGTATSRVRQKVAVLPVCVCFSLSSPSSCVVFAFVVLSVSYSWLSLEDEYRASLIGGSE